MRVIKSLLIILISLFVLASCDNNAKTTKTPVESLPVNTTYMTIGYSYHYTKPQRATKLISGSFIFFETDDKLIAGDVYEIKYTGEMRALTTYPSQIMFGGESGDEGEFISASLKHPAKILECVSASIPGSSDISIVCNDSSVKLGKLPKYIVLSDSGDIAKINEIEPNKKLFIAYRYDSDMNNLDVSAIYSYNPYTDSENFNVVVNKNNEDEVLKNYLNDFKKAINKELKEDYTYVIEGSDDLGNDYYNKELTYYNGNIMYKMKDAERGVHFNRVDILSDRTVYYVNGIIYEDDDINYYKDEYERLLLEFANLDTVENGMVLNNKKLDFFQIDPCCGGPKYITITDIKTNYVLTYHLDMISTNPKYMFDDVSDYISYIDNYEIQKKKAEEIELEVFNLLDKAPNLEEGYIINKGFGIYKFMDEKYDSLDQYVEYHVTSYPDCYFSMGEMITTVEITDKNYTFNGMTLNDNKDLVISYYENLGYACVSSNDKYIILSNGFISIRLVIEDDVLSSIIFSAVVTNILNIVY